MEIQKTGLREQKHIETRRQLEEAAISLATNEGLESTTIDAISDAAKVSRRTFFNYFDSKESAVLGIYLTDKKKEDEINTLVFGADDDIVESVVSLILDLINPTKNLQQMKKKIHLIRKYPVLFDRQINRISKIKDVLNAKVDAMIQSKYPDTDISHLVNSEVVVMACVGGVRIAVKEWLGEGAKPLTDHVNQRAVEIIKNTIKVL